MLHPHVRRATPEDESTLVDGNRALASETESLELDVDILRQGVRRALHHDVGATYYVATEGPAGRTVGQLMITTEWSDWRNGPVWWIQSVFIWPDARRAGVFRALYETVLAEALSAGAVGVRLYVDQRNHRAQAVYARLGMDGDHYRMFETLFSSPELPPADP